MKLCCRLLSSKCFILWDTVISTLFSTVVEFHVLVICCSSDGHVVILIPTHSRIALKSVWLCHPSLHFSYLCWTSMVLNSRTLCKTVYYLCFRAYNLTKVNVVFLPLIISMNTSNYPMWGHVVVPWDYLSVSSSSLLLSKFSRLFLYFFLDVKTFAIFYIFLITLLCAFW